MKHLFAILVCVSLLPAAVGYSQTNLLAEAQRLENQGSFEKAASLLATARDQSLSSAAERKLIEFELDRLDRIKKDFPFTAPDLFAELSKSVRDLTRVEFDQWLAENRFDSRTIEGTAYFMHYSVPNLFFRYPELGRRRLPPVDTATLERRYWETSHAIRQAALDLNRPYVLPKKFRIVMAVVVDPDVAPAGETIRAWLPVPRQYAFQDGFNLLSSSPPASSIDTKQSPIRCVYLEQAARKTKPAEFKIEYDHLIRGVRFELDPEKVKPCDLSNPSLLEFASESPHVFFTTEIRTLSLRIAGREPNPYLRAKLFYDWISANIKYSYAVEYSTVRNLGEYCRDHGYGDCGQEAFLFITLCRLNGIPARWQSGWSIFPGATNLHDWTEIYLAPYGWMPVDPYMGIFATRYATSLTAEQRRELRDFYFGGLDQYRIIANGDHNQALNPPKQSMRSDPVDFQRGELEWRNHNIYFDRFSYNVTVKELKSPPTKGD